MFSSCKRKRKEKKVEKAGLNPGAAVSSLPDCLNGSRSDYVLGRLKRIRFVTSFNSTVWSDSVDGVWKEGGRREKK